jgi:prevent-host-death family protein
MRFTTVRELKNKTSAVVREVQRRDVIVTCRGKPVALIQSLSDADLEDYIFYSSPAVRRQIERRWRAYQRAGKTVPLEVLRRRNASPRA